MKRKGPTRDREKEGFWRQAIRQQQRSGQSIRAYCRDNALSEPSFYAWRRAITRRNAPRAKKVPPRGTERAAFVPVRVAAPIEVVPLECVLPSGAVLRWPAGSEPAAVAALIRAWEQLRC